MWPFDDKYIDTSTSSLVVKKPARFVVFYRCQRDIVRSSTALHNLSAGDRVVSQTNRDAHRLLSRCERKMQVDAVAVLQEKRLLRSMSLQEAKEVLQRTKGGPTSRRTGADCRLRL